MSRPSQHIRYRREFFRFLAASPLMAYGLREAWAQEAAVAPLAKEVLIVKAPGPALADPAEFKWTKLRKGVRLRPLGPVYS